MGLGEADTESLILQPVVLDLLAGGCWWCEAQSLIYCWLETHGFENVSPWEGSDLVKETHCAVRAEW